MIAKLTVIFAFIQPALLYKTEWLRQDQYCLPRGHQRVIHLSSNGADSSVPFSLLKDGNGYASGSNCSVRIEAPENQFLSLVFDVIDTEPCTHDSIVVESISSTTTLCGSHKCPSFNCPQDTFQNVPNITVTFQSNHTEGTINRTGFHAVVTAYNFVDKNTKLCPGENRFECENQRCIWEGFHCDGHNHCGDNSDEPPGCAKTVWGVLVIVLGLLSLCFFLPLFCYLAIWGGRRKVPVRIVGNPFFANNAALAINDEENVPILSNQLVQGNMPGETFTFYYGSASVTNPRC